MRESTNKKRMDKMKKVCQQAGRVARTTVIFVPNTKVGNPQQETKGKRG